MPPLRALWSLCVRWGAPGSAGASTWTPGRAGASVGAGMAVDDEVGVVLPGPPLSSLPYIAGSVLLVALEFVRLTLFLELDPWATARALPGAGGVLSPPVCWGWCPVVPVAGSSEASSEASSEGRVWASVAHCRGLPRGVGQLGP